MWANLKLQLNRSLVVFTQSGSCIFLRISSTTFHIISPFSFLLLPQCLSFVNISSSFCLVTPSFRALDELSAFFFISSSSFSRSLWLLKGLQKMSCLSFRSLSRSSRYLYGNYESLLKVATATPKGLLPYKPLRSLIVYSQILTDQFSCSGDSKLWVKTRGKLLGVFPHKFIATTVLHRLPYKIAHRLWQWLLDITLRTAGSESKVLLVLMGQRLRVKWRVVWIWLNWFWAPK